MHAHLGTILIFVTAEVLLLCTLTSEKMWG